MCQLSLWVKRKLPRKGARDAKRQATGELLTRRGRLVVAHHPDSLRATVLCAFLPLRLLRFFAAQPSFTSSWKHSGFNLHAGEQVPPEAKADFEGLAQYILRNPFSVEKMTLESPGDMVIYRSRLNAKINRNFEVFTPTDFLAAITQHIPDKGAQMVRYYGWYSNKMRGVRQRGLPPELVLHRPGVSPPPPLKLPSKRWRDLILRVWHADPLRCPVCQNPMRVIAIIDDARVVEKVLRHLGAWHDPPPRPPPSAVPGPYTYEPCDDVDPTPDYENVLTD